MNLQFEPNHLKYFYFTVLEGGVGLAAERLHVQQPVVSKMIKGLEEKLSEPLFRKVGRKKELTDFGQLVYRHCKVVFQEIDKIGQLHDRQEVVSGSFSFGAAEPIAAQVLPDILADIMKNYPHVHANVYTSTAAQLLEMISQRQLEFGLFFHIPKLIENLEIAERVPTNYRLVVKKSEVKNKEVIQRFIGSREIDDTSTHRFPTVEKMRKKYPETRIVSSSNHIGLHRELVLRGQGVSILPEFLVREDIKKGRLTDVLPKEKFIFDLKIVKRKADMPSRLASLVVEKLRG